MGVDLSVVTEQTVGVQMRAIIEKTVSVQRVDVELTVIVNHWVVIEPPGV